MYTYTHRYFTSALSTGTYIHIHIYTYIYIYTCRYFAQTLCNLVTSNECWRCAHVWPPPIFPPTQPKHAQVLCIGSRSSCHIEWMPRVCHVWLVSRPVSARLWRARLTWWWVVAVCCSRVLQCGAVVWCSVWCSVVQRGAVWCSVVQCGAVWCIVVQCVAVLWYNCRLRPVSARLQKRLAWYDGESWECVAVVCCSVVQCGAVWCRVVQGVVGCCSVGHCRWLDTMVICINVFQCVVACCSVLQCVAVFCSIL